MNYLSIPLFLYIFYINRYSIFFYYCKFCDYFDLYNSTKTIKKLDNEYICVLVFFYC